MELYGSLQNRMQENKMYCKEIKVGTGMTEYSYSDRHAYEVVKVIDQTNVFVREYDHKAIGEPMSNKWELISNENNPVIELKLKNNVWYRVVSFTKELWTKNAIKEAGQRDSKAYETYYNYYKSMSGLTDKEKEKVENGKTVKKLRKFGNVSFGVADYYFDYEF